MVNQELATLAWRQRLKPTQIGSLKGQIQAIHNQIALAKGIGPLPSIAAGGQRMAAHHAQGLGSRALLQHGALQAITPAATSHQSHAEMGLGLPLTQGIELQAPLMVNGTIPIGLEPLKTLEHALAAL
jgi:hypothetical protein